MRVKYVGQEKQAENIISFYFEPQKKLHYIAGQFIELYLPHEHKDNRGIKRWFTLSSSPSDDQLAITTNFTKPRGSSFKQTLLDLKIGQEVDMASPMGDFVLPKDKSIPLVFVAGGIGCTPFHSIIRQLNYLDETRDITLLYSAKKLEKVAFLNEFKEYLNENFKIILQDPPKNWKGEVGQLTPQRIKDLSSYTDSHYIYVSGPEPMVEKLFDDLKKAGVNKKHIYTDFFPNYEA